MAKINTQLTTIPIYHPNDKDLPKNKQLVVYIKELDPVEAMELFSGVQKFQKVFAVLDGEGKPIEKDGDYITKTLTQLPASATIKLLEETIESWDNLNDENDKPIPYKPDNIRFLFNRALNCKIDSGKKDEKGKPIFVNISYPDYIGNELSKSVNEGIEAEFNAPKEKTSPKRA